MPISVRRSLALAGALAGALSLGAEPAVIGLARAYLGPDSSLDSVQSVHFKGVLDRVDPDHPDTVVDHATLDMIVAKPSRQRQIITGKKATEITVLDGYEAWDFLQDNADPTRHVMTWLKPDGVRSLQASTWENLHFYRGLKGDGAVVDKGPSTVDGIACERVDYVHSESVVFERYFDRDSGRLVHTLVNGEDLRESGEIRVDGIRFPKSIVSHRTFPTGKHLVATVVFDSIALNEPVDASTFAVPTPPAPKAAAVAAGSAAK